MFAERHDFITSVCLAYTDPQWLQHNSLLESCTESVNEAAEEHDRLTAAEDYNEANSSCENCIPTTIGFPSLHQISTILPILLDPQQNTSATTLSVPANQQTEPTDNFMDDTEPFSHIS